ncbi:hypothetical protein NQZ68_031225 [Dissostichus eleginoides]|nr:hypothetical protein NQZ68_031225 [Dissostichus eleginoides]
MHFWTLAELTMSSLIAYRTSTSYYVRTPQTSAGKTQQHRSRVSSAADGESGQGGCVARGVGYMLGQHTTPLRPSSSNGQITIKAVLYIHGNNTCDLANNT